MAASRAATRYARSLFEVAREANALDAVSRDCATIDGVIAGSRDLQLFLASPVVNTPRKTAALKELFGGRIGDLTQRFILLLAAKGREGLLRDIIAQFYRIRDDALGVLDVTARTAVPMTKEQRQALTARLEAATKKNVRVTFALDPSLKGGFTIQYDDTVWDASLRHQLEVLRQQFAGAA